MKKVWTGPHGGHARALRVWFCYEGGPDNEVSKEAQEHLKQVVKPFEHNCPKGDDLLVKLPSSSGLNEAA